MEGLSGVLALREKKKKEFHRGMEAQSVSDIDVGSGKANTEFFKG